MVESKLFWGINPSEHSDNTGIIHLMTGYLTTWHPCDFEMKVRCKEGLLQTILWLQRADNISGALLETEQAGSGFYCALFGL